MGDSALASSEAFIRSTWVTGSGFVILSGSDSDSGSGSLEYQKGLIIKLLHKWLRVVSS